MVQLYININPLGKLPKQAIIRLTEIFHSFAKKKILVTVEIAKDKKTLMQLAYHFGVIVKSFSAHMGYTLEECHGILKYKSGFFTYQKVDGKEILIIRSASNFNKEEMSDLIQSSISYCENLGIKIPSTEEYWENNSLV